MFNNIVYILSFAELMIIVILSSVLRKQHNKHAKHNFSELEKWHHMALTDDLTKIPNRAAYNRHMTRIQNHIGKENKSYGIMLFDIDNFKNINDTYGHLTGDKTLQYVASMLSDIFRSENYNVYRIGGDEFAVIAENTTEKEMIDLLLEVRKYENSTKIYLSKGYSIISETNSAKEAFSIADKMLYADKSSRKTKQTVTN